MPSLLVEDWMEAYVLAHVLLRDQQGLRGAMAFALALQSVSDLPDGHGHVFLTATLLTIAFTVFWGSIRVHLC